MNPLTPLSTAARGGFKASCDTARAIGKASDSAHLRQERRETPHQPPRQRPRMVVELVSQAETKSRDPFRDAPRLNPAFVTQLLGQVMQQEQNRPVRSAYGVPTEKFARLFDTRF